MYSTLDALPWVLALLALLLLATSALLAVIVRYWHQAGVAEAQRQAFAIGYNFALERVSAASFPLPRAAGSAPGGAAASPRGAPAGNVTPQDAPAPFSAPASCAAAESADLTARDRMIALKLLRQVWS